jgi:hypothetical protein
MTLQLSKFEKQFLGALGSFVSRIEILPANMSPLGSFGFFGGNTVLYFVSIIAFDLLVKGTYAGFWFTYLGFAMYPLLGYLARKNWKHQALLLPAASFLFFLLSNLGVWWYWFDHTWEKLLLCYTLALPFYQRTLIGDLAFGYGYLAVKALYGSKLLSSVQRLTRTSAAG